MCGGYALYGPHSRLREQMLVAEGERYNIAPQSNILVVRFKPLVGRVGQLAKWGLIPSWAKEPSIGNKLNNARGETVAEKPVFRSSFARHRCLIPANGFYEWAAISENGKVRKQPYYVHPAEPNGLFAFAGLLAVWKSSAGDTLVTTCIITSGANAVTVPIHDRMPVILQPEQYDAWLDPSNQDTAGLQAMLGPCCPDLMRAYPVSPVINSGRIEGGECIAPIEVP